MSEDSEIEGSGLSPEYEKETTRLSPGQWTEIVEAWELGTASLAELRHTYGISRQAISVGLKRRGAVQGRRKEELARKVAEAATTAIATKVATFADGKKARIEKLKTEHDQWASALARLVIKKIVDADKASLPIASATADINALKKAAETLAVLRQERYVLNEVETEVDPDQVDELPIEDLTTDDIEAMRIAQKQDEFGDDDLEDLLTEAEPGLGVVVEEDEDGE